MNEMWIKATERNIAQLIETGDQLWLGLIKKGVTFKLNRINFHEVKGLTIFALKKKKNFL